MSPEEWTHLTVPVMPEEIELVADRLWGFDPAAIEEISTGGGLRLVAGFARPVDAEAARAALTNDGRRGIEIRPVIDDGLDNWRAWATPHVASPFVILPAWLPAPAAETLPPDHRALLVDPGRTFGSGSHPTTRLVLGCLASVLERDTGVAAPTVLDVGTGSGVLAVAAALIGAGSVTAIDIDPDAPEIVAANAALNGVGPLVDASTVSLAGVVGTGARYEVVVANLLAPIIRDLAADLVRVTAPEGALVVSGLLVGQVDEALANLAGLEPVDQQEEDGWAVVVLRAGTEASP